MSKKVYEMTFEIGGKVASSLATSFRRASGNVDDLRDSAKKAKQQLSQLKQDFKSGRISQEEYAAATSRVRAELSRLASSQQRVTALSQGLNKAWNTTKAVTKIAAVTTAVAATAVAMKSLSTAADFEAQMSKVQAKTMATGTEMKALNETALSLGASTSLSSSEVGRAMDELAAKGFDANKIIGAMPGIIAGAEASGEDLALVSDTVATAINVWGLKAEEASKVADVLAMSANVSAAGVDDLAQVFKYAGTPAAMLGIQLEEVAAAAGIMTDAGLEGSNAGTSLRAALLKLNAPATKQSKQMKALGFSMQDSKGKTKDLAQLIEDLSKSTAKQSDAQKAATLSSLVGTEAVSGFLALMNAGPQKIREMTKALEESEGSAAAAAAILKDNYAGAFEEMTGAMESAQIRFATPILPVLQKAFMGVSDLVSEEGDMFTQLGEKAATSLTNILAPLGTKKPELTAVVQADPDAMAEYQKAMAEHNQFAAMDLGDKVTYMLDEAVSEIEGWLAGDGGKAVEAVFSKVGEIAAKTWYSAFTGAVKGSVESLSEGNIAGAAGLGAAAYMMGGGALLKGGGKVAKWGTGKVTKAIGNRRSTQASSVLPASTATHGPAQTGSIATRNVATTATHGPAQTGSIATRNVATTATHGPAQTGSIATRSVATTATRMGTVKNTLGGAGKLAGKAALPLAVIGEGYNIAKSEDKVKTSVQAASGIGGGLAGAKLGAVIGTAILPGIGTAIGSALGGLGGFVAGKFASGKAVDGVRNKGGNSVAAKTETPSNASTKALATTSTKFTTEINNNLAKVREFSAVLPNLIISTNKVNTHMQSIASLTMDAQGWVVAGLFGIKVAGEGVQNALKDLEQRIRNTSIPGASGRLSYE